MLKSMTVYVGHDADDIICWYHIFQNEEGDCIIVPDWYLEEFRNSCWYNAYNIEVDM